MEIGAKIKNARIAAQLTQEQVAEALGVSRQTISNWENGKTYPDIVSVIKMSDLYTVSLDYLLKEQEEISLSNYMDYLEESSNTVKSQKKLSITILLATYLGIWAFALIVFWFFIGGSDAMGYSLIFLWIILPVSTMMTALMIGKNNYFGKRKWLTPIAFGVMHMLAEYATFSAKNMIAFHKINVPQFELIVIGAVISFAGMGIGTLLEHRKQKRHNRKCDCLKQ
jgi:transcriptional regulator with XRE-family HTH domain